MLRSAESDSRKKKTKHYIFSSQLRASKSYSLPWGKLGRPGNCCEIQLDLPEGQSKDEMGSVPALPVALRAACLTCPIHIHFPPKAGRKKKCRPGADILVYLSPLDMCASVCQHVPPCSPSFSPLPHNTRAPETTPKLTHSPFQPRCRLPAASPSLTTMASTLTSATNFIVTARRTVSRPVKSAVCNHPHSADVIICAP